LTINPELQILLAPRREPDAIFTGAREMEKERQEKEED
jgi:hypothetical protein